MTEHWAIDASPLILLGKANQLDWLPGLGRIVIPSSVALEISAGSSTDPARQWLSSGSTRDMIREDINAPRELLSWDLGNGETSVIAWCQRVGRELLSKSSCGDRRTLVSSSA